jgi:sugar fermentation stimulation protein A
MDFPEDFQEGVLIKRYKRFLADVQLPSGEIITAHCPNTGAMSGCAEPGSRVWLQAAKNQKSKYAWGWRYIETEHGLVNIYSAGANALFADAFTRGQLPFLDGYTTLKREYGIAAGKTRVDALLTGHANKPDCLVEIKSVTLLDKAGLGLFPDARSERALKHVDHLCQEIEKGMRAALVFVVQHEGINRVAPAHLIYPEYAERIKYALKSNLEIYACKTELIDGRFRITDKLPFLA